MTDPYSPPTSNLAVNVPPQKRTMRCTIGFASGFFALPFVVLLFAGLLLLAPGITRINFTREDLPGITGWVLLIANGALCALWAARFPRAPFWLIAISGFALPALLFLIGLVIAVARLAA